MHCHLSRPRSTHSDCERTILPKRQRRGDTNRHKSAHTTHARPSPSPAIAHDKAQAGRFFLAAQKMPELLRTVGKARVPSRRRLQEQKRSASSPRWKTALQAAEAHAGNIALIVRKKAKLHKRMTKRGNKLGPAPVVLLWVSAHLLFPQPAVVLPHAIFVTRQEWQALKCDELAQRQVQPVDHGRAGHLT